jgi:alkylation response protein AidB-like acyl-CoA dehydrogenase
MDFTLTDEHQELKQTVRRFLDDKSGEQAVRATMETERGYDPEVWRLMADQGLQGMIVPERHGGVGYGHVELMLVMEQMGAALLCAPYLSSAVLATCALLECADEAAKDALLPGMASGETLATLAFVEPAGRWELDAVTMAAAERGGKWTVSGPKAFVLDGHVADVLLVVARTPDGLGLFRVDADAAGVSRTPVPTLDLTRKLADVSFADTPATLVSAGDATGGLERALARTVAALAAEQVGGAQRCLDMSVEYARTRLQFGRAIGSFQAIKHRCADMLVQVEFARSAAYYASFAAAAGGDEVLVASSLAKSYCSEAFFRAAADTIQIHGGMGFTWEHPAHLYLKRAKSSQTLFGSPVVHRARLAEHIGL